VTAISYQKQQAVTSNIRWQTILVLLGSLLLIALLGHLTAGRTTVLMPAVGGRYVEALVGYPRNLSPLLARYGTPERDLCALIFSGLTRAEASGEMQPNLAQAWEISGDALTYTFYLRQDVRWHDGTPFTAQDVAFTVGLVQSSDFAGLPELAAAWQDVETQPIDAYTVVFRLPQAYAPFLEQTTLGMLPSHILSGVSPAEVSHHSFSQQPVGTGPFRLETLTTEYARLVPHTQYYGPRPYLNTLDFRFYPDAVRAMAAYTRGEVMGVGRIPPALLSLTASQPDLNLFTSPLSGYTLVVLNNRRPIFSDRRVRQALVYALDRQALIDRLLNGQGIVAHSPIMPGHWAYEPDVQQYYQDIRQAKKLLGQARLKVSPSRGRRMRDERPLAFTLLTDDSPGHQQLAAALADQWSHVGVRVTVEVVPAAMRDSFLYSYQFDAVLLDVALSADPDAYPWWHSTQAESGQNFTGFSNFAADEVLQQARLITQRSHRWAFYRTFQQVFAQEVPAILLYYPVYIYGVDQRIKDVQQGPLLEPSHRFRGIHHWYLVTQRVIVQQPPARTP
jgi:peptide/nickel transport system substrate-binding protein